MKTVELEVKTKKGEEEVTSKFNYKMAETVDEAVQVYGEEVVFELLDSQIRTNAQNIARAALREGRDPQQAADGYTPGVKRERAPVDPVAATLNKADRGEMSADDLQNLIAQLQARLGSAG